MPRKSVKQSRKVEYTVPSGSYLDRMESSIKSNQSKVSMILGALIILVIGILFFNYFSKSRSTLGPAQQTTPETSTQAQKDVAVDQLPGKYTVKEGDTLFLIAEKYYKDGYKFSEIATANNLSNVDAIEKDQVLEIPKIDNQEEPKAETSLLPTSSPQPTPEATATTSAVQEQETPELGSKIEGTKYTVVEGDWLSTIAGRAYGDIYAYQKIAQANDISNPDLIEPGMVLTLPR